MDCFPLGEAEDDGELAAHCLADGMDDAAGKTGPAYQVASVFVRAPVGLLPEKLVNQVAVRSMQFHTVKTQPLGVRSRPRKSIDNLLNFSDAHRFRRLFQRVYVNSGRADGRQLRIGQVFSLEGPGHAHMPELRGYFTIRGVDGFQHLFPSPQGSAPEEIGIVGGRRGAGLVNESALRDDEPYFMSGPPFVISGYLVRGNPVGRKSPGHGRKDDAGGSAELA